MIHILKALELLNDEINTNLLSGQNKYIKFPENDIKTQARLLLTNNDLKSSASSIRFLTVSVFISDILIFGIILIWFNRNWSKKFN